MMELHGGKFGLTSNVGVGTEAKITFPPDRVVDASAAGLADMTTRQLASAA
jgi:hypothetical protein